jgi:hypothetical protein
VWGNAQIAAGYDIDGIGLIRAQYVGVKNGIKNTDAASTTSWELSDFDGTTNKPNSRIEAAFGLTAVKGLTLDLGFKYYLPSDEANVLYGATRTDYTRGVVVGLGGRYAGGGFAKGAYAIEGRVDAALPDTYKNRAAGNPATTPTLDTESGFNLNVHLTPSYNLGPCTLGADLGLDFMGDGKSGSVDVKTGYTRVGLGVWAQKGLGMAKYIKAGLGVMLPYTDNADTDHGIIFSVPLVFQYAFF